MRRDRAAGIAGGWPERVARARAWWPFLAHGAGLAVVLVYARVLLGREPWINDAHGFWVAWQGGLYDIPWLERGAYVYSPAFAQAIAPLTALPFEAFWALWLILQFAALLLIAGPAWAGIVLLLPWPSVEGYANAVPATIWNGNPQLLLALAIVAGLRWPGAWALPILTKVTPGIGLLWFAVRREWLSLAWAAGATLGIVLVSAAFDADRWLEWLSLLAESSTANTLTKEPILPLPLLVRLPIAVVVVVWGALTNRYWTVPVAATLALPAIQLGGFAILVAALPFLGLPLTPHWPLRDADRSRGPSADLARLRSIHR